MHRVRPIVSFLPVLLLIGGFVWFTIAVGDPLERAEKEPLAVGVVVPDEELLRLAPLQTYVALYPGTGRGALPQFPVDEALTEDDGSFVLRAYESDGERFFLFVRVEAADFTTYCATRPLPPLRAEGDGGWVVAATGAVPPLLRIEVDPTGRCPR